VDSRPRVSQLIFLSVAAYARFARPERNAA
jgi:hypothetical protein